MPTVGSDFVQLSCSVDASGDYLPGTPCDSIKTIVTRDNHDSVSAFSVSFVDTLIREGVSIREVQADHYRYAANGDVSIRFAPFIIDNNGFRVEVEPLYVRFPTGTKRDYVTTMLDTSLTTVAGSETRVAAHQVVDRLTMLGPEGMNAPDPLRSTVGSLTVPTLRVHLHREVVSTVSMNGVVTTASIDTLEYAGWYSPGHGYMVRQGLYTPRTGGRMRIAIPATLP